MPVAQQLGASPSSYEGAVEITLPVDGDYGNDFDAGRAGGRVHRATDIFAEMGTPVHAAMGGTVSWAPREEHETAGFALQVQGDDGRMYAYYHLGEADGSRSEALADGIDQGVRVERGQVIGYLGNSGNARTTPPHLHFEIHDPDVTDPYGSNRLNPYASLLAAAERGDRPGAPGGAPDSRPDHSDGQQAPGEVPAWQHRVEAGETLSGIAREHGLGGWRDLADLNPDIGDPDVIFPEQVLRILAVRDYRVRRGDTLSAIARDHGLDGWERLVELNPEVRDPDLILPEQVLVVPER